MLEDTWLYERLLIVQKYDSMKPLLAFWNLREHAEAQKLRSGHVGSHFVLGVEVQPR